VEKWIVTGTGGPDAKWSRTKLKKSRPAYLQRKVLEYEEKLAALRALLNVITEFQVREDCSFLCKEAVEGIRNYILSVIRDYALAAERYRAKLSELQSTE
jgi:hypothetical protein